MRSLAPRSLALVVLCGGVVFAPIAWGQTVHVEEFSNDQDQVFDNFEPSTRILENESDAGGAPPVGYRDIRNIFYGVIEENLTTVDDDPSYPAADPGAATTPYGVIQKDSSGEGPYWFQESWDAGQTAVTFNTDVYADPVIAGNGNGVLDFWWSNGVNNAVGTPEYQTEQGFIVQVDEVAADTWSFTMPGTGVIVATVPVGQWYEMETSIYPGVDGTLDATSSLWNADHTVLLGSHTQTTMFLDPVNQTITPRYTWFTFFEPNLDMLFIDDVTISSVPEPAGAAALGFVAMTSALARRRRRR